MSPSKQREGAAQAPCHKTPISKARLRSSDGVGHRTQSCGIKGRDHLSKPHINISLNMFKFLVATLVVLVTLTAGVQGQRKKKGRDPAYVLFSSEEGEVTAEDTVEKRSAEFVEVEKRAPRKKQKPHLLFENEDDIGML